MNVDFISFSEVCFDWLCVYVQYHDNTERNCYLCCPAIFL